MASLPDFGVGYGLNRALIGSPCRPRTLSSLKHAPSGVALHADDQVLWNFGVGDQLEAFWGWWEFRAPPPDGAPRHQGGNNFVYADGHARWGRPVLDGQSPGVLEGYYPSAKLE